jgi:2-keto-3-deoxy-galactonokinase
MINRITYMSQPTIESRRDFQVATAAILEQSRANNLRHDLSGVLVGNEKWFVQVLEGPYQPLHGVLNKILADTRHHESFCSR